MMFRSFYLGTTSTLISVSILLLRIAIGLNLFVVGAGKVMGWFGGMGMEKIVEAFEKYNHFSPFLTYLSSYTEFLGGILLILGLFTRPAAFAVMINMAVATYVSLPRGYTTLWAHPFSLFIIAIVILLSGPMYYSLDNLLFNRNKTELIYYENLGKKGT